MASSYDDIIARMEAERQKNKADAETEKKALIEEFRRLGINKVDIDFDGSGDSGSIHSIIFDPSERQTLDDGTGEPPIERNYGDLYQRVENWAYQWLEGTGVDWYNNEGGFGTITFDLVEGQFNGEVYYRIESSELGHGEDEAI